MPVLIQGDGPGSTDPSVPLEDNGYAVWALIGAYKMHVSAEAYPAVKLAYGNTEPVKVPQASLKAIPTYNLSPVINVAAPSVPAPVVTVPPVDTATVKAILAGLFA